MSKLNLVLASDRMIRLGDEVSATVKLLPPNSPVRVQESVARKNIASRIKINVFLTSKQDLKVILRCEVKFNLRHHEIYHGRPMLKKPLHESMKILSRDKMIRRDELFRVRFKIDPAAPETYEGNVIRIVWTLETSYDPIGFWGGRERKINHLTVRSQIAPGKIVRVSEDCRSFEVHYLLGGYESKIC